MKQILCLIELKVGTIPFYSSHMPPKNSPALKQNSFYFSLQTKNLEKQRNYFFFSSIKKKMHSKNMEGGLEVSETANESWSINI